MDPHTTRRSVSSGSPYEAVLGISRAVRIGQVIAVTGTAPIAPDGSNACVGDAAGQARRCLEIIRDALAELDADLSDVIRTRTLLTHIDDWKAVGVVHGEVFAGIRPANTIVEVSRFIDPEWRVEFEVDAVVRESDSHRTSRA